MVQGTRMMMIVVMVLMVVCDYHEGFAKAAKLSEA
jgi:hypothetical protein